MGVLPLQFKRWMIQDYFYAIRWIETFDIRRNHSKMWLNYCYDLEQMVKLLNSDVLCRLDTSAEVDVYKNGGILQKFTLKDVIASSK